MPFIVCKFGGTSVSTAENWHNIATICRQHHGQNHQVIVVCSAYSQVSNLLEKAIEAALVNQYQSIVEDIKQKYQSLLADLSLESSLLSTWYEQLEKWLQGIALLGEASPKTHANILALGELMMSQLGQAFLSKQGLDSDWLDARQLLTTRHQPGGHAINYLAARCQAEPNPTLIKKLTDDGKQVYVTQGFIAHNEEGETVLLGRGGSDTSGGLIAATVEAKACEIWTDVPGIYTANPYELPNARLLKQLNYDEAQEIATMGAKVLHPNCIPPVRAANIPLSVKYTRLPEHPGTKIGLETDEYAPPIKSIQLKNNVMLLSIDTLTMWQQVGFLADVFQAFKTYGFSVDLLSSSEFNVTVSLDNSAKLQDPRALKQLVNALKQFGHVRIIEPCSAVSLVGHRIRTVLPQLGPTLALFDAQQIYMMSLASNDLNLTFVVDESQATKLCQKLHALLIENNPQSYYYSKSWREEFGEVESLPTPWWEEKKAALLKLAKTQSPAYVYDLETIAQQASKLKQLTAIDTLYYAIKANPNPAILKQLASQGVRFECVSKAEIDHVRKTLPKLAADHILFTPNFAAKQEYDYALNLGCHVTIDNAYPLLQWPDLFSQKAILLRIDPGSGAGHHKYVCTGGNESKFGIVQDQLTQLKDHCQQHHITIKGLHVHSGSGILTPELWQKTALMLAEIAQQLPDVSVINCGGGLGIVEKPGQTPLDLVALNEALLAIKAQYPHLQFWLEPGRYFVAESGVILAKVTQLKQKGDVRFIGIETGMNSLIRPALYGAYHPIFNLTKLDKPIALMANIVGPICESGDTLGYDRGMPTTEEGDVILIANTGAYGYCMGSHYNLRPPAHELTL
ncbi:bifunctional aspartate kinase/diaminopimelate decarboxylase [Legionella sp. W05-934-2]|jgi:diaminopimelate decarboxylase/aspartate kinase|uniref:bifunctional aspartate kinase/diaminopimelate decarboxylase n=1 Tax=Legionella sp. W05-934-2 TaxID=1198649 RepID=UPI003461DD12